LTVIGAEGMYTVNGKNVRGREYPWGICEVDNTQHCDFPRLRYVLLNSHLQDLKDITHDELYEKYRTQKLISEEKQHGNDLSRDRSNPELNQEAAKQVMIKEEMLKKEEEKLREMELKVQRGTMDLYQSSNVVRN
jgi:cell division control protein 11